MNENVAIYWDFENIHVSAGLIYGKSGAPKRGMRKLVDVDAVMTFANSLGNVTINRAYANWQNFAVYSDDLQNHSTDLVQIFHPGANGKNGADIRLSLDALEDLLTNAHITKVIIVGGDSDYIGVAQKVRRHGRSIIGIGVQSNTNVFWTKACNEFKFYKSLLPPGEESAADQGSESVKTPATKQAPAKKKSVAKQPTAKKQSSTEKASPVPKPCLAEEPESYQSILARKCIKLVPPAVLVNGLTETFKLFSEHGHLEGLPDFRNRLAGRLQNCDIKFEDPDATKIKNLLYKARCLDVDRESKAVSLSNVVQSRQDLLQMILTEIIVRLDKELDGEIDARELSDTIFGNRRGLSLIEKLIQRKPVNAA